jgi:hypothetical protein
VLILGFGGVLALFEVGLSVAGGRIDAGAL